MVVIENISKVLMSISFLDSVPQKEHSLKFDLGIDSMRLTELIVEIENELEISFDIADLDPERLNTVGDIYALCGV